MPCQIRIFQLPLSIQCWDRLAVNRIWTRSRCKASTHGYIFTYVIRSTVVSNVASSKCSSAVTLWRPHRSAHLFTSFQHKQRHQQQRRHKRRLQRHPVASITHTARALATTVERGQCPKLGYRIRQRRSNVTRVTDDDTAAAPETTTQRRGGVDRHHQAASMVIEPAWENHQLSGVKTA